MSVTNLSHCLAYIYPVRQCLLGMLKPLDIVSLVNASGIVLTGAEDKKHLVFWKQIFYNLKWVHLLRERGCTVTIIGNDLRKLHTAIIHRDHTVDATLLKSVIVIGESPTSRSEPLRHLITSSFDASTIVWHEAASRLVFGEVHHIDHIPARVRTCIVAAVRGTCVELDSSWASGLADRQENIQRFLTGPGKPFPSSFEAWESEWQQFGADVHYNPTHMHYLVEPLRMDEYKLRLFVNAKRSCCALLMRVRPFDWDSDQNEEG